MSPTETVNTRLWNAVVLVRAVQARVYELDAGGQIEPMLGDVLDPADELTRLLGRAVDELSDVAVVVDRLPEGSLDSAVAKLEADRSAVSVDEAPAVARLGPLANEPIVLAAREQQGGGGA